VQVDSQQPTIAESKRIEDAKNLKDWGSGKGNNTPAYNKEDKAYVQVDSQQPTIAESKRIEDEKNLKDWGSGKGNNTPAFNKNDKAYVQIDEQKKEKMVTPTVNEVRAELEKDKQQELIKPTLKSENEKDIEPKDKK